jgi:lysophospholipase L1-like esterase
MHRRVTLAGLSDIRLGVLAFGDSITNGGGELQWGVALQSWALWVARATGLAFTNYAADGASVQDVVNQQIPAFELRRAHPGACYDIGAVYIGVNDVRAPDWNGAAFAADFERVLAFLGERCERTLTLSAPLDLGRPRAGAKVRELDAIIEEAARRHGALLVDLRDFGARNLVMADHVHPTAFGQIAIAERALGVLERNGLRVAARPSHLTSPERPSARQRLLGDLTYVYRRAKVGLKGLRARALAGATRPQL